MNEILNLHYISMVVPNQYQLTLLSFLIIFFKVFLMLIIKVKYIKFEVKFK